MNGLHFWRAIDAECAYVNDKCLRVSRAFIGNFEVLSRVKGRMVVICVYRNPNIRDDVQLCPEKRVAGFKDHLYFFFYFFAR